MHQSREMDWRRTRNVITFVTCLILIAAAIGVAMIMLFQ